MFTGPNGCKPLPFGLSIILWQQSVSPQHSHLGCVRMAAIPTGVKTSTSWQFQKVYNKTIWRSAFWEIQDMDWNKTRYKFVIFRFHYKIIIRLTDYIKYAVSHIRSTVTSYGRNSHPSKQLTGVIYVEACGCCDTKKDDQLKNIEEKA